MRKIEAELVYLLLHDLKVVEFQSEVVFLMHAEEISE